MHEQGKQRVTVVVADDHPLYREGVVRALLASGNVEIDPAKEQSTIDMHVAHASFVKALGGITPTIGRYERYADRFRTAMDRVDTGATEYVTSPTVDSLHNIWFEFHEDLLRTLGRERSE